MSKDPKFDLEERTAKFGEDVIKYFRDLPKSEITRRITDQLVGCSTSVGANYCEADDAESSKDFRHKIGICKKESREAKHFLRMSAIAVPEKAESARKLWIEAKELNLIFNSIYKKEKINSLVICAWELFRAIRSIRIIRNLSKNLKFVIWNYLEKVL